MKTWQELLSLGGAYLEGKGVPDAAVAMELLMARLLKCGRGFLSPHLAKAPEERIVAALRRGMARLAAGEPIQYVLGEWDFRSLTLSCDRRALIPRPETEELVTRVLAFAKTCGNARPFVVDVGTGSGCIILSLAREMDAARCGLADKVRFAVADGLDDFDEPETIDILVSNPPYIPTAECATLDPRIRNFEPMNALDGGRDGLDFYDRLIGDALNVLRPGGGVFFEIGDGQGPALQKRLFDAGFDNIRVEPDYAGHDRYASAVLPS